MTLDYALIVFAVVCFILAALPLKGVTWRLEWLAAAALTLTLVT
jgi:hypothetical protein